MTWIGRDALGRITDFTAQSSSQDTETPPNITVGASNIYIETFEAGVNTTGFVDNANNAGLLAFEVPVGALFQVRILQTAQWNQAGGIFISAGSPETATGSLVSIASYLHTGAPSADGSLAKEPGTAEGGDSRWCVALEDVVVYVGFYSDATPPSAGSMRALLFKVLEPA